MKNPPFPILENRKYGKAYPLTIPWSVAELAYSAYRAQYGSSQTLQRLAERGGFGPEEMDDLLPGWIEQASEIFNLRHQLKTCQAYAPLYEPLADVAREFGYALCVHGSKARDLDLVAVPWTPEAKPAKELAQALMNKCHELTGVVAMAYGLGRGREYFEEGSPGSKPHGRLGWVFTLGSGGYIDLSVMPRQSVGGA